MRAKSERLAAPQAPAGFVLAGGRSSRMGADKALELLGGRALISRALELLREAGLSASIAGAASPLEAFAPVIHDGQPGNGPLGGICAALAVITASTSADWAVFLSVDLPLLPASLVVFLLRDAQTSGAAVTLCSVNGFAQTVPALAGKQARPALEKELDAGRRGCFAAFQAAATQLGQPLRVLPVEYLLQAGQVAHAEGMPATRWFLNMNARADLEFAGGLLRGSRSGPAVEQGFGRVK